MGEPAGKNVAWDENNPEIIEKKTTPEIMEMKKKREAK